MTLAHYLQSQMPFAGSARTLSVIARSYRADPRRAPRMWAASPFTTDFDESECEPLVGLRHEGLEHVWAARFASTSTTIAEKSGAATSTHPLHQPSARRITCAGCGSKLLQKPLDASG